MESNSFFGGFWILGNIVKYCYGLTLISLSNHCGRSTLAPYWLRMKRVSFLSFGNQCPQFNCNGVKETCQIGHIGSDHKSCAGHLLPLEGHHSIVNINTEPKLKWHELLLKFGNFPKFSGKLYVLAMSVWGFFVFFLYFHFFFLSFLSHSLLYRGQLVSWCEP